MVHSPPPQATQSPLALGDRSLVPSSSLSGDLFQKPEVSTVKFLFLVGGFAEAPLLQQAVQAAFGDKCRVIIPQDVGLTILKGAVLFGLDPAVIKVRRSPLTYGVGVLNRYVEGKHPPEKLLVKDGTRWCTDIFDKFISADQSVALGELVKRSYTPAKPSQLVIVINIYSSERDDVERRHLKAHLFFRVLITSFLYFITDHGP